MRRTSATFVFLAACGTSPSDADDTSTGDTSATDPTSTTTTVSTTTTDSTSATTSDPDTSDESDPSADSGSSDESGGDDGPCSSSLADVSLPLCDGTYEDPVDADTFEAGSTIRAQHAGKVVFTGSFAPGEGLVFRGIVVTGSSQKDLGANNEYEDMSFVGGPPCGNVVNSAVGAGTTVRRSAFYGPGGRYQLLAYQVSDIILEDILIRSDGGWGLSSADCTEFEPNAALNFYDSSDVSCTRCVLFDGINEADGSSETLGGLGANCHESADNQLFEDNLIVDSQGGFFAEGNGSCGMTAISNSAAYGPLWGVKRNVGGSITATNFSTDGNCGAFEGEITLVDSSIAGEIDGCTGATAGAGGTPSLDAAFLDSPRWRQEMCTDAGVSRGWCAAEVSLSEYLTMASN